MTDKPVAKTRIVDLLRERIAVGQHVSVQGWVRTRRDSKAGFSFVHVLDGSCVEPIQVVVPASLSNYADITQRAGTGASLCAEGVLSSSQGKGQAVELHADRVTVVGDVDDPETYPMQAKRHSREYLRSMAHLRPRTNLIGAITRLRHTLSTEIHRFFDEEGFYWIHTPIITASDCEGAGESFRVSTLDMTRIPRLPDGAVDYEKDFFGREAHLTVSGQLNVEAYCLAMSRVYTFGPTFRAENSHTRRHLAEFWMVEPEIAFADLQQNIAFAEQFLKRVLGRVLQRCDDEIAFFQRWVDKSCRDRLQAMLEAPFATISYSDAIEQLSRCNQSFEFEPKWGCDLQAEHEQFLTETVFKGPVVVTNYPKTIKAFYMRLNNDEKTVAAMDVLVPGIGEIIGGSQREERLDVLDQRISELDLVKSDYWWYRDLRRYGSVPHAGFGLGLERALLYLSGIDNVRDVIPFPRTPKQADF